MAYPPPGYAYPVGAYPVAPVYGGYKGYKKAYKHGYVAPVAMAPMAAPMVYPAPVVYPAAPVVYPAAPVYGAPVYGMPHHRHYKCV